MGEPAGLNKPSVKPAEGLMGFADLQDAANTVRKSIAQATTLFMSTSTQGSNRPPAPDMVQQSQQQQSEWFGNRASQHQGDYNAYPQGKPNVYQEDAHTLINMPPTRRADKAMQYVKFWQRPGMSSAALLRKSPLALFQQLASAWRLNEINIHPTYLVLAVLSMCLLAWTYAHPVSMPWRPDGLFYYHNDAYDTCVSHYSVCQTGKYVPDVGRLSIDMSGLESPGRGGPRDSCKKAYVMMLLSDEYLPAVLTSVHMIRKYARTPADYVVIVTPAVTLEVRQVLYQSCLIVKETAALSSPVKTNERRPTDIMDSGRKDMYTKLMVWALDEYEKVIYLDSDLIILRNMDELLNLDVQHGQIYAPALSYSDPQHFGGYMVVLHPAMDTAKQLKAVLESEADTAKRHHIPNDQVMLNDFFADSWLGNPTHRLPWGLVTMSEDLRRSPKLVLEHVNKTAVAMKFQGDSNTKAWLKGLIKYKDDPEMMYFLKLWWRQYYEMTDRQLPPTIDMYSLLELGEYDLYWRSMHSPMNTKTWFGRK